MHPALRSNREVLEDLLVESRKKTGLDDTPESRKAVLEYTVEQLKNDLVETDSLTSMLAIRAYIRTAQAMLEEL